MFRLLLLLAPIISWGYEDVPLLKCPSKPSEVVMFIDSCPTTRAHYVTQKKNMTCESPYHADYVIKTYQDSGGSKKVWLWAYNYKEMDGYSTTKWTSEAIRSAMYCDVKYVNYSGGGYGKDPGETQAVKDFIAMGGTLVAAAGNEGNNIDIEPFFPASLPGVIAVAGRSCEGLAQFKSNFGSKVVWEQGCNTDRNDSGSSYAAPRHLAALELKAKKEVERRRDADRRRKSEWQRHCRELKASFCNRGN